MNSRYNSPILQELFGSSLVNRVAIYTCLTLPVMTIGFRDTSVMAQLLRSHLGMGGDPLRLTAIRYSEGKRYFDGSCSITASQY